MIIEYFDIFTNLRYQRKKKENKEIVDKVAYLE